MPRTPRTLSPASRACVIALGVGALIMAIGCAGKSERTTPAGSIAGNDAGSSTGAPGGSASDPNLLKPELNPPPPEGDGRLVDIGDALPGFGWDWCGGEPRLMSSTALPCADCPPATRGDVFVIATPAVSGGSLVALTVPQGYFFFDQPTRADAVWFDAMSINGATDATLSVWPSDTVCQPIGPAHVLDLHALFTQRGQWVTACVPLTDLDAFRGLAIRIDSAGALGLDAFRFGPPCPELR